ncbi:hypothetical protein C426_1458 [Lactococcus garvieae DCC43]|uniref:Uncharacterized protein n=1 Tax=Lactococcus garvieae DCC43 TaxID=1231377 RepID=K2PUQ2_9LACT|nr:hypothetical protein C426_1458 [Lactococcus garvieae DCC43]
MHNSLYSKFSYFLSLNMLFLFNIDLFILGIEEYTTEDAFSA